MGLLSNDSDHVCPAIPTPEFDSTPLFRTWTAHHLFLVLGGVFGGAACIIALMLYMLHATHCSVPREQDKILRIIFFYPVLAAISIGSIALNNSALYLQPWGDIYEAFALANFFLMVSTFISDDFGYHEQYFDTCPLRNGKVAGASWFRHSRRLVFQYLPVSIIIAIATDITLAANIYCVSSNSVHFPHIWLNVIKLISVGIAAISAIGFTIRLKTNLKEKNIVKKLLGLKLVIGLSAISNFIFSILRSHITPTSKMSYVDITIALPALLTCIELFLISIFLHVAYPWKEYKKT